MKRVVALLTLPLLLTFCYGGDEDVPYRPPGITRIDTPDEGGALYQRDCAWCHGNRGEGTSRGPDVTEGTNGPALNHFMLTTGRMPIAHPKQRVVRRSTPYTGEQIDAIVDFMRGFDATGPEIPEVDLEGDLTRGLELYQENCAACHSTTGIGGALTPSREDDSELTNTSSLVAPGLGASSPLEIAEATRTGPGTMPVFGAESISDSDLSAIVRYVVYLQDPDDSGGAPLGRVGPVVEGAIGWLVGLGVLLLFIRWMGTKRGDP